KFAGKEHPIGGTLSLSERLSELPHHFSAWLLFSLQGLNLSQDFLPFFGSLLMELNPFLIVLNPFPMRPNFIEDRLGEILVHERQVSHGSYPASSCQVWVGFSGRIFYVGRVFVQRKEFLCRRDYMGKAVWMAHRWATSGTSVL